MLRRADKVADALFTQTFAGLPSCVHFFTKNGWCFFLCLFSDGEADGGASASRFLRFTDRLALACYNVDRSQRRQKTRRRYGATGGDSADRLMGSSCAGGHPASSAFRLPDKLPGTSAFAFLGDRIYHWMFCYDTYSYSSLN
jgi:hypothetical protein